MIGDDRAAATDRYYRAILDQYEAETANRGDERFWAAVAERWTGGTVLELGAGTGRVTAILARTAALVVAVDVSPAMLERARPRLSRLANVRLVTADMAALRLRASFDLVVGANDPWSHLLQPAARQAALGAVAAHLAASGRFILDALWFNRAALARCTRRGGERTTRVVPSPAGPLRIVGWWRCTADGRCLARYDYRWPAGRRVAAFRAQAWTEEALAAALARAGLVETARWGDYSGSLWSADAPALVVEARRTVATDAGALV
jgi:SAM-dependent methyltransferase